LATPGIVGVLKNPLLLGELLDLSKFNPGMGVELA